MLYKPKLMAFRDGFKIDIWHCLILRVQSILTLNIKWLIKVKQQR